MILSDRTIREELDAGRVVIDPLDESCIQPSSVDLRLDRLFRVFLNHTMPVIDVKQDLEDLTRLVKIDEGEAFILHPGEFVLGSTYERVSLPDDLVGRIEGKSSLGRLGLIVHATAGFVDPGFSGTLTLEITNLTRVPIVLWPGKPIAQLSFMALDQAAERPYGHPELGSHYHGQLEATESRYEGGPRMKPETR
jgi:dCTP deaminase